MIQDHRKTIDPRTSGLERARLGELQNYANEHGVQYDRSWGAAILREVLKNAGKTDVRPPFRPLGAIHQPPVSPTSHRQNGMSPPAPPQEVPSVDWVQDLVRQQVKKPVEQMNITELRQTCKAKGIKLSRKDTIPVLKEKLAAHG